GLFTPTTVTFSEDVERIGANAFSGSRFLTVVAPQDSLVEQFVNRYNEDDARRYLPPLDKQCRVTFKPLAGTSMEKTDDVWKINLADYQLSDDGKTLVKYVGKFIDKGNEARVPNSVEIIGDKAFAFRTDLKKIVLPEGLKVIGNRAFDNCMSLQELNIPNGVERIGVAPFSGTSLKSIVVPKSVGEISELAFSGASALRTVTFSADVEKLDNSAFIGTYFLTVVAPKGSRIEQFINEYNEDRAKRHDPSYDKEDQITFFPLGEPIDETVADYRFSDDGKKLVKYFGDAEEVRVPEGVEFIGRGAFENRATIKSLILPDSVNEIGERAFVGLASEATITFSGDVENVWNNAFVGNSFLTVVAPKASKIQQCIDDYNQKNEAYAKIKKDSRIAFVPLGEAPEEGVGDVQGDGTTTKVAVPDDADYQLSDDGKVLELYWGIDETFAVPEGVETINADAIRDPGTLTKVVLPASVTSVEKGAFASAFLFGTIDDSMRGLGNFGSARGGNRSLTSIEVAEDNPNYRSIDGVLFSKDGKTLLRYPAGREQEKYVVPEGVETIGPNAFSDCYSLTEIELPSSVTAIESGAFQSCSLLKSIVLPDGITAIKNRAFGGCYSLESVVFPKNLTMIESFAFSDCVALAELVLPESLKTLGEGAFAGCVALESVRIPRSVDGISVRTNPVDYAKRQKELEKVGIYVDYITPSPDSKGRDVFEGCSSLAAIDVDEENSAFRSIDGVLFSKDVKTLIRCPEAKVADVYVTPEGVETIEEQAFSHCVSINRIVVSEGVTRLMHNAFSYCDSLKSLSVPASVPYLSFGLGSMSDFLTTGSNALASIEVAEDNPKYRSQDGVLFSRDGKILIKYQRGKDSENYVVPNSVEEIGEGAFMSCSQLKTLAIPEHVVKIGENAFAGCVGLTSIDVDENNPAYCSIDGALFSRNESAGNLRTLVKYPSASGRESYVVPSFVEEVAINAFNGASSLKSIEVPQNVEKLEIDGVWNCPNLESINVVGNNRRYRSQDGVLFYRNGTVLYQYPAGKSDENYVVPRGVDSIGPIGSGGCDTLKTIKLPEDLRRLGIGVFDGCDALTSIEVDAKNEYYRSVDGVLFSKDNNSLVKCPKGKISDGYVVPDDVVKIGARAFDGCSGLTSIALSDGVEEIGSNAFANCSNLKTIEIPASVVSISQDAFPVDQELTVRAPKGSEAEAFVRRAAPRSGLKLETIERKPRKPKKPVLPQKNRPLFID
ncbi:MAG: leucine-rich repeat protein, partial [Thermoguttaceae bacterium]|nr:leucine-rich repeat protein [Thermoguttaceae bacterium]